MTQTTMRTVLPMGRAKKDPTNPVPGVPLEEAIEVAQETLTEQKQWDSMRAIAATIVRKVAPIIAAGAVAKEREEAAKRPAAPVRLSPKDVKRIRAEFLDALIQQARRETVEGRTGFYDAEIRRAADWLEELK